MGKFEIKENDYEAQLLKDSDGKIYIELGSLIGWLKQQGEKLSANDPDREILHTIIKCFLRFKNDHR